MFEEGSFRRRPRGFRRKAMKPYPSPLYPSCSTGGVLPAPDGPPVRHVPHYGDAPSPAVCQASSEYHETSLLPSSHHFSSSPFNNNCHVLSSSYYNYPVISSTLEAYPSLPPMEPSASSHYSPRPNPPDLVEMVPASPGVLGAQSTPNLLLLLPSPLLLRQKLLSQAISWTQNLNLGSTKTTPKTTRAFQRTTRASRKITHPFQKITHPSQKSTLAFQKTMRACRRST